MRGEYARSQSQRYDNVRWSSIEWAERHPKDSDPGANAVGLQQDLSEYNYQQDLYDNVTTTLGLKLDEVARHPRGR